MMMAPPLIGLHCMTWVRREFETNQGAHPNQPARAVTHAGRAAPYGAITLSGVIGVLRTRRPVA